MIKGKLCLVDLAGSERSTDSATHDQERQRESIAINKSLMALKECIRYRVMEMRNSSVFVPFRGSRLTLLLKESFTRSDVGTIVIVAISPLASDANHSLNTCRFADRIKEKGSVGTITVDPLDPHTWGKKEVAEWVRSVVGAGRKSERLFTPMTGKRLCNLTQEEFAANCSVEAAGRMLYEALHKLVQQAKDREQMRVHKRKHQEVVRSSSAEDRVGLPSANPRSIQSAAPSSCSAAAGIPQKPPSADLSRRRSLVSLPSRRDDVDDEPAAAVPPPRTRYSCMPTSSDDPTGAVPHSRFSCIPAPRQYAPGTAAPSGGHLRAVPPPARASIAAAAAPPPRPLGPPRQLVPRQHDKIQPQVSESQEEEFEQLYQKMRASVDDGTLVAHNNFRAPIRLDSMQLPYNDDDKKVREWVTYASDTFRSIHASTNKILIELVARVLETHKLFMSQSPLPPSPSSQAQAARERDWLCVYEGFRTGFTWPDLKNMLPICGLATEYPRLLYSSVPFLMLVPHAQQLAARLPSERDFWMGFGASNTTHSYMLGPMPFTDCV
eukprot:TRINITY_DN3098_c0_g1_i4.p1 TRINITY_DN3098_c0_g1~~TRINITY_DN3098_c0_g1_i4.p1  ORF type:complete len:551 (-),score=129.55 TRINITY_DN3098_c0_g1_i4:27-1679(-)